MSETQDVSSVRSSQSSSQNHLWWPKAHSPFPMSILTTQAPCRLCQRTTCRLEWDLWWRTSVRLTKAPPRNTVVNQKLIIPFRPRSALVVLAHGPQMRLRMLWWWLIVRKVEPKLFPETEISGHLQWPTSYCGSGCSLTDCLRPLFWWLTSCFDSRTPYSLTVRFCTRIR